MEWTIFFFKLGLVSTKLRLSLFHYFLFLIKDKILQTSSNNETIQVTNDGATILKAIGVDNSAAKVLVGEYCIDLANVQE